MLAFASPYMCMSIFRSSGVKAEKDGARKNGAGRILLGIPIHYFAHPSNTTSVAWMAHFNSPKL